MKHLSIVLLSVFIITMVSCSKNKKNTTDPTPTVTPLDFSFIFPDSIIFDNKKTISIPFECKRLAGTQDPNITVWMNGSLPSGVSTSNNPTGKLDFSGNIDFTCTSFTPGVYSFTAKASTDIGSEKVKTSYIVMRPTCSYDFNKPLNVKKTTYPSGSVNYSTSYTSYNTSNNLLVNNILASDIELIFNCDNQTIQMKPMTNSGYNYTGNGSYNSTTIFLDIYINSNLSLHLEMTK